MLRLLTFYWKFQTTILSPKNITSEFRPKNKRKEKGLRKKKEINQEEIWNASTIN